MEIIEGNKYAVIYKINCLISNKYYVGSTVDLSKRKSQHIRELRLNKHHCKPLQAAFNKYGEANFNFSILETFWYTSKEDILAKEQIYLDAPGIKYNTFLVAGSPLGIKYGFYSETRKGNMSKGMKGISKTSQHKELLSKAKLSGTANDISIESIHENGTITKYRSISEAYRITRVGVQTIYDSINKKSKKWKRKTTKLTWRLAIN